MGGWLRAPLVGRPASQAPCASPACCLCKHTSCMQWHAPARARLQPGGPGDVHPPRFSHSHHSAGLAASTCGALSATNTRLPPYAHAGPMRAVAEEGIDVKSCQLVVRYDLPNTAQVGRRGGRGGRRQRQRERQRAHASDGGRAVSAVSGRRSAILGTTCSMPERTASHAPLRRYKLF